MRRILIVILILGGLWCNYVREPFCKANREKREGHRCNIGVAVFPERSDLAQPTLRVPLDQDRYERIKKAAYEIYKERMMMNEEGTEEGDWLRAERETPKLSYFYVLPEGLGKDIEEVAEIIASHDAPYFMRLDAYIKGIIKMRSNL